MGYRIEKIEGIGPSYGARLKAAGIENTDRLLASCGSAAGRRETAARTGLKEAQLLAWANMADLMRIKGVGEEYSELLEAAGVDTVKELKMRRADNLTAKMAEVNARRKLVRVLPSEKRVADWIAQAKSLRPVISH